jgi:glutathione peroxidase-family protein
MSRKKIIKGLKQTINQVEDEAKLRIMAEMKNQAQQQRMQIAMQVQEGIQKAYEHIMPNAMRNSVKGDEAWSVISYLVRSTEALKKLI